MELWVKPAANAPLLNLGDIAQVNNVYLPAAQSYIVISEDRLRLHLTLGKAAFDNKSKWGVPLGILLTVLTALLSADFKDWLFDRATWRALFVVIALFSFGWLMLALCRLRRSETLEDLIEKVKNEGEKLSDKELLSRQIERGERNDIQKSIVFK